MSDRAAWLEQWCPGCRAAPGARCRRWRWASGRGNPAAQLHVARGWPERSCPKCKAQSGERCATPTGREASQVHVARLRPARWELVWRPAVWEALERRGASVAVVPFWGRAGRGGQTDTITLLATRGNKLVDLERWTSRDELCQALEAPIWDRFGTFAEQPLVRGEVIWSTEDRSVVICGKRVEQRFEEIAA